MGRYAFFNTEFEYKFAFGVQDSSDIQYFGGIAEEIGLHTWTQDDKIYIYDLVKDLCDFDKYEKNLHGTYALEKDLQLNYTYNLGCLIYHQLLYTDVLCCEYES